MRHSVDSTVTAFRFPFVAIALAASIGVAGGLAGCGGGGDVGADATTAAGAGAGAGAGHLADADAAGVTRSSAPRADGAAAKASPPLPRPSKHALDALGALGAIESLPPMSIDTSQREAVQLFHQTVHASSVGIPVQWTGSFAGCDAGDTSAAYRAGVERRINWTRAMAGVGGDVRLDPALDRRAQHAALMMAANFQLSHSPPPTWLCWSDVGADAAARSNLALSNGMTGHLIDGYVEDSGSNNPAVGHRRWLLRPGVARMGTGDVATELVRTNALWVLDAAVAAPVPRDGFVAWPPPGFVPHTAVYPRWSLSLPGADFAAATVAMWQDGRPIATTLEPLADVYGDSTLVWLPGAVRDGMAWERPSADTRYDVVVGNVRVGGLARELRYTVTVFDGSTPGAWGDAGRLEGVGRLAVGQQAVYRFRPVAGATGYQWRVSPLVARTVADGAEQGGTEVTLSTSPGYDPIEPGAASEGQRSFHLAQVQPQVDQTITLRRVLVPGAASVLSFASRLGRATPGQLARVEASTDDGRSWIELGRQAGSGGAGESVFRTLQIPLSSFAGRQTRLRFRYSLEGSTYYDQAGAGFGWNVDDIRVSGADVLDDVGTPVASAGPQQPLSVPGLGRWLVQARPGMFGAWADWSAGIVVTAAASTEQLADCLFDWGERAHPALLRPAPSATRSFEVYRYRAYADEFYVGLSVADAHLWTLSGGVMQDLGPQDAWLARAGC